MGKRYNTFALLVIVAAFMTASCQRNVAMNNKVSESMTINDLADENGALPGKFSVSDTKQVHFSRGNLYWDGSAFEFEDNQYDFQSSWDRSHVSHFFWSRIAPASYDPSYRNDRASSDVFFTNGTETTAKPDFKVNGVQGKYRTLSAAEWTYLLKSRINASSLYKCGVTVCGKANCLILAPDDFTGTVESSYDASNWPAAEAAGLVCLPASGGLYDNFISNVGGRGGYWSSSAGDGSDSYSGYFNGANPRPDGIAHFVFFNSGHVTPDGIDNRNYGCAVRLITECQ